MLKAAECKIYSKYLDAKSEPPMNQHTGVGGEKTGPGAFGLGLGQSIDRWETTPAWLDSTFER